MSSEGEAQQQHLDSEELRQAALFASGVLAMQDNPKLLAIAERTAALLNVAVAAIVIVDGDRLWCPAIIGWEKGSEAPRDHSFSAEAIRTPDRVMIVPDASKDNRFRDSPAVMCQGGIRFYAGMPIVTSEGAPLGSICAVDPQPRDGISEDQEAQMRALAHEAMQEIEKISNLRRFGADAIGMILEQMSHAARQQNEPLMLELDQILQKLEDRLNSAGTSS